MVYYGEQFKANKILEIIKTYVLSKLDESEEGNMLKAKIRFLEIKNMKNTLYFPKVLELGE